MSSSKQVPETHELIKDEDIQETLDVFREGNSEIAPISEEQIAWLKQALEERKYWCAKQYHEGIVDGEVGERLQALDQMLASVSPQILPVLHFLGRIRAIVPVLQELQQKLKIAQEDPNLKMVTQMQLECSKAEVKSAIDGLAKLRVRPRILDSL